MSATRFSSAHRGLTLALLAFVLGASLSALVGSVSDTYANGGLSAHRINSCQDAAAVLASAERSRNGVSLTCNSDTLSGIAAE